MSNTPVLDEYLKQSAEPSSPPAIPIADATQGAEMPIAQDQSVNVINPTGKLVSVPQSQLQSMDLLNNGYSMPKPEDIEQAKLQRDYGGEGSQFRTAVRGLMEYPTLGTFPLAERAGAALAGQEYNPETIAKEEAANPWTSGIAKGIGLLSPTGLLGGPLHLIEEAAKPLVNPAIEAIAPYVPKYIAKIGDAVAKGYITNVLAQAVDETSKSLAGDPAQNIDTVIANLKFSGLLGAGISGGFGAISPLWEATAKTKTSQILQSIVNKVGGVENVNLNAVDNLIKAADVELSPEIKSSIMADPKLQRIATELQDSSTSSAQQYQAAIDNFHSDASDSLLNYFGKTGDDLNQIQSLSHAAAGDDIKNSLGDEIRSNLNPALEEERAKEVVNDSADQLMLKALGKTPEDVAAFKNTSDYETGKNVLNQIAKEYEESAKPISDTYQELQARYKKVPLSDPFGLMGKVSNVLQKYEESPNSPQYKMLKNLLDDVPNIKTMEGLRNLSSNYSEQAGSAGLWQLSKEIRSTLFNQLNEEMSRQISSEAPELVGKFQGVQNAYHNLMNNTEFLNDRLHIGKYNGPGTFANALKDAAIEHPEKYLARLNPSNDAALIEHLKTNLPKSSKILKDYNLNNVINRASFRAAGLQSIEPNALYSEINKLGPEMKAYLLPEGAASAIENIKSQLGAPPSSNYVNAFEFLQFLNKRLRLGKFEDINGFVNKLSDIQPEILLNRLSKDNDAELLRAFSQSGFVKTAAALKEFKINEMLKDSLHKIAGQEDSAINLKRAFSNIKNMSPELKDFLISHENQGRISALEALTQKIPSKENFSGTAKVLDNLWSNMPANFGAFISWLTNKNPATGWLFGQISRVLGREAPDAAKLALLKFMGSSAPINPSAFKTMFDWIQATKRGENLFSNSVKNVFKTGVSVAPQSFESEKEREKFDKKIQKYQTDQEAFFKIGGNLGHYMPEHQTTLVQSAANTIQYLNSIRPQTVKQSPLDEEMKPSKAQMAEYNKALDIAEQPLSILQKLKEGTLALNDVMHLQTMYPGLYQKLNQGITHEMMEVINKGEKISYKMRLGLSRFLGEPLDSTMTPEAIQASQMVFQNPIMNPSQKQGKVALNSFKRLSEIEQTPSQRLQSR
jgi:hypothetical protein